MQGFVGLSNTTQGIRLDDRLRDQGINIGRNARERAQHRQREDNKLHQCDF
jgi:hypothetical protein